MNYLINLKGNRKKNIFFLFFFCFSDALKSATLLERGNCTFQEKAENLKKVQTDTFGIINVSHV